jgi:CheY-like chemotaxis protein
MSLRIIVVEDEVIVAMDIQHRLERMGHQVLGLAVTGDKAVRLAREVNPDLIFMDIKLRGMMDGIEAANHIRAFSEVPIIYLTAFADDHTIRRASSANPIGYLGKPFEDRELQAMIELALKNPGKKTK